MARDDVDVGVGIGEKTCQPLEQEAGRGDVDNRELPTCAEPDPRQRFVGLWSAADGPPPFRVLRMHRPIPPTRAYTSAHVFDRLLRVHGPPTAYRRGP